MFTIIVAGGLFNAIRGGQWRVWFNIHDEKMKFVRSDVVNAAAFALTVWAVTGSFWLAFFSFFFMWLGAAPGWGDYVGALGGWRVSELKENALIDPLIKSLTGLPKFWGAAGLTIRGLFWGICLAVPFWLAGEYVVAQEFVLKGALMAPAYWLAIEWMRTRVNMPDEGWGLGEIFYGIILWSGLGVYYER